MNNSETAIYKKEKNTKVAILMCTYNGQRFLQQQLDSFLGQDMSDWCLWVSDDGSRDDTLGLLYKYKSKINNQVFVVPGPKQGFVKNFLSLVCNPYINSEYYAYSDQDDIWHENKLSRAIQWLDTVPKEIPALYGAMSCLIDKNGQHLGLSNIFTGPFGFKNAMVQNIAAGNTMVFNQAACDLLRIVGADINVAFHDWWTYIVISGCGGKIFIDQDPVLKYRQHGSNIIGSNNGFKAKIVRIKRLLSGHMRYWNTQHVVAMQGITSYFTLENQISFRLFSTARDKWLFPRLVGIKRSGIYRQTSIGNIGLVVAAFLKKL